MKQELEKFLNETKLKRLNSHRTTKTNAADARDSDAHSTEDGNKGYQYMP